MITNIDSKTRLLGLFGNPAKHSLSPLIQNYFLDYYKINCVYLTFEPHVDCLQTSFNSAKNLGFIGLNITMPFKEKAYKLIDKAIGAASIIKTVNTIKFFCNGGTTLGFSTDGEGVIKSFHDKKISLQNKNILLIGAGGAAKSAFYSILKENISKIFIYDLIMEKPKRLIEDMKKNLKNLMKKSSINSKNYSFNDEIINNRNLIKFKNELNKEDFLDKLIKDIDEKIVILKDLKDIEKEIDLIDIIMNCTPVGMDLNNFKDSIPIPDYWNLKDKIIFEMVYNPVKTRFLKKACLEGASEIINGIDMLVNQAVFSFNIWFDIMPEEKIIKRLKRKILKIIEK